VTGVFKDAKILVKNGAQVLFEEQCDMTPEKAYLKTIDITGVAPEMLPYLMYVTFTKA